MIANLKVEQPQCSEQVRILGIVSKEQKTVLSLTLGPS